ncbi:MAG: ABC transporter ATP-binding protein [Xanthobacteraceae bacterium]|nr:MAG: ABC transporter ATP-binding protein [Xanthobacteraceae bacterium]
MSGDTPARLQASGVGVSLGGRVIVSDATLSLKAGEFTVMVGPNGAGKTTLMRALAGLARCSGEVRLDGHPLAAMKARERARRLAYLPQGHVFHWPLDVATLVELGREPHADPFTPLSAADHDAVAHAMAATGVTGFADRAITTLSGGEQARVAIARALATQADVLLADEPIGSLDARHQLIVLNLLRRIARDGAAVLAIIHDLTLAARFADHIAIIADGRIVVHDTPERALEPARIAEIFGVTVERFETADGPVLIPSHALGEDVSRSAPPTPGAAPP